MTNPEERRPPRDCEEAAAFKELGRAIASLRERRGMGQDGLAAKCEMTRDELEEVELGRIDESWGGLRCVADALGIPFEALMGKAPGLPLDRADQGERPSPGSSDPNQLSAQTIPTQQMGQE